MRRERISVEDRMNMEAGREKLEKWTWRGRKQGFNLDIEKHFNVLNCRYDIRYHQSLFKESLSTPY